MKVRGTLALRNETLLAARERLGLTQAEAAELAGIMRSQFIALERLDFSHLMVAAHVDAVAVAFDVPREEVMPDDADGRKFQCQYRKTITCDMAQLEHIADERHMLPVPDELEPVDIVETMMKKAELTYRERTVLELRFGLNGNTEMTLEETGRILKATRERIRQVEAKAIRKMAQFAGVDEGHLPSMLNLPPSEWKEGGHRRRAVVIDERSNT